ncbi:MAG: YfhO family protein [Candidatus Latescibacterota bacterium]|nr:YfhO family protein [Candidatus Latescibacterota bacterium]
MTARNFDRQTLWAVGGVCALVVWFFADAALGSGAFFVQDVMAQNVPFRHHLHAAVSRGTLPLWVPEINAGFPLFAEGQVGALYPPNLLFAMWLSPWQAVNASVVTHLMLAAATMVVLLRHLGSGLCGAIVGGLSYGLSGYLVVRAMSPNFLAVASLLPALLLFVDATVTEARRRPLLWASAIVALQCLAGHPQATAYGVGAAIIYAALRTRRGRLWGRVVWVAVIVAGAGACLAAVQLLPTFELASLSLRSEGVGFDRFVQMSMAPERLLTLLLPSLLGDASTGTYWGAQGDFFIQMCPYLGILALPLAGLALGERREASTFALGVIAAAGLILSLGKYTGLFELLYSLPPMRAFRIPTRFLLWWAVAGAALVGLGTDRLLQGPVRRRYWLVSACLLLLCIAVVATLLGRSSDLDVMAERMVRWRGQLIEELLRATLILGLFALLVVSNRWRQGLGRTGVGIVIPLVVLADLGGFGRGFNAVIDPSVYERVPQTVSAILLDQAPPTSPMTPDSGQALYRVASLVNESNSHLDWHSGWRRNLKDYRQYPETLRHYTGGLFGLANAEPGWSPLHLARHWEVAQGFPALFPLASVAYLVIPRPSTAHASHLRLPATSMFAVERVPVPLPRAYVVHEAIVIEDDEDRVRALLSNFDPFRRALLSSGQSMFAEEHGSLQAARVAAYDPTRVVIDLPRLTKTGYLILTDTAYPGWVARVDGEVTPIETANHVFRGVRVPPSARRVVFDFEPASLMVGGWLSCVAGLCWLGAFWWTRRRRAEDRQHVLQDSPTSELPVCSRAWLVQGVLILLLYGLAMRTSQWLSWSERLDVQKMIGAG